MATSGKRTWALAALLSGAFAFLWLLVGRRWTREPDRRALDAVHRGTGDDGQRRGFEHLSRAGRFCFYWPLLAAALLGFLALGWVPEAIQLLFAYLGGQATYLAVRHVTARRRPEKPWSASPPDDSSFPSSHATVSVTVFSFPALLAARRLGRPWRVLLPGIGAVLGALLACSRLVLAVHHPSDVLAGLVIGAVWALLGLRLPLGGAELRR